MNLLRAVEAAAARQGMPYFGATPDLTLPMFQTVNTQVDRMVDFFSEKKLSGVGSMMRYFYDFQRGIPHINASLLSTTSAEKNVPSTLDQLSYNIWGVTTSLSEIAHASTVIKDPEEQLNQYDIDACSMVYMPPLALFDQHFDKNINAGVYYLSHSMGHLHSLFQRAHTNYHKNVGYNHLLNEQARIVDPDVRWSKDFPFAKASNATYMALQLAEASYTSEGFKPFWTVGNRYADAFNPLPLEHVPAKKENFDTYINDQNSRANAYIWNLTESRLGAVSRENSTFVMNPHWQCIMHTFGKNIADEDAEHWVTVAFVRCGVNNDQVVILVCDPYRSMWKSSDSEIPDAIRKLWFAMVELGWTATCASTAFPTIINVFEVNKQTDATTCGLHGVNMTSIIAYYFTERALAAKKNRTSPPQHIALIQGLVEYLREKAADSTTCRTGSVNQYIAQALDYLMIFAYYCTLVKIDLTHRFEEFQPATPNENFELNMGEDTYSDDASSRFAVGSISIIRRDYSQTIIPLNLAIGATETLHNAISMAILNAQTDGLISRETVKDFNLQNAVLFDVTYTKSLLKMDIPGIFYNTYYPDALNHSLTATYGEEPMFSWCLAESQDVLDTVIARSNQLILNIPIYYNKKQVGTFKESMVFHLNYVDIVSTLYAMIKKLKKTTIKSLLTAADNTKEDVHIRLILKTTRYDARGNEIKATAADDTAGILVYDNEEDTSFDADDIVPLAFFMFDAFTDAVAKRKTVEFSAEIKFMLATITEVSLLLWDPYCSSGGFISVDRHLASKSAFTYDADDQVSSTVFNFEHNTENYINLFTYIKSELVHYVKKQQVIVKALREAFDQEKIVDEDLATRIVQRVLDTYEITLTDLHNMQLPVQHLQSGSNHWVFNDRVTLDELDDHYNMLNSIVNNYKALRRYFVYSNGTQRLDGEDKAMGGSISDYLAALNLPVANQSRLTLYILPIDQQEELRSRPLASFINKDMYAKKTAPTTVLLTKIFGL